MMDNFPFEPGLFNLLLSRYQEICKANKNMSAEWSMIKRKRFDMRRSMLEATAATYKLAHVLSLKLLLLLFFWAL